MGNQNQLNAILLSLALHMLAFVFLFDFNKAPEQVRPVEIELISSGDITKPVAKKSEYKIKDSVVKKLKKEKSALVNEKFEDRLKAQEETAALKKPLVGESNVELELEGVAPKNERQKYLAQVRGKIAMGQVYPKASRRFREEGTVRLLLTVERNGSLSKIEVVGKSKFKRLDDAALKAVTKVAPFNSFPKTVAFHKWKIKLPIKFSLSHN